ncbi:lysophospholipase [bacterium]|nr:lysophospholipase [bacterium]
MTPDTIHGNDRILSRGAASIFEQWWLPPGDPRAVVAIVHGYAEHSGRYAHVAAFLNARGYAVEALDLRGHGQSSGRRVYVHSFSEYLSDVARFLRAVNERHPGKPVFLLGHSMGGGIATLFVIARKPDIAGLILSGPALRVRSAPTGLKMRALRAFGKVMPAYALSPLPAAAISRDATVVQAYENDPLVYRGGMRLGHGAASIRALQRVQLDMEEIELPLLVMHGSADRLTSPEGSEELVERARSTDKTLKIYDGLYHEIFNEPEQQTVMRDLATWLDAHTAG